MAVLAAENSAPYVATLHVACFFEYQSIGVWFMKCSTPDTAFPDVTSCNKFASLYVVIVTVFPLGSGTPGGTTSFASPYAVRAQSYFLATISE